VDRKKHEILAVCGLVFTLLIFFSLISFRQSDYTVFNSSTMPHPPQNWVGFLGAHVAWILYFLLGLGAYWLPLTGLWFSWSWIRGIPPFRYRTPQLIGIALLLLSFVSLASIHEPKIHVSGQLIMSGGLIGRVLADFLVGKLYSVGAHVLLIGILLVALLLATPFSLMSSSSWLGRVIAWHWQNLLRLFSKCRDRFASRTRLPQEITPLVRKPPRKSLPPVEVLAPAEPQPRKKLNAEVPAVIDLPQTPGQYTMPSLYLLDAYETEDHKPDWRKLEEDSHVLEEKLADFGVQGKVVGICPGPVITMYEYAPAPGIKISRIVGLSDDLSMALKAISIRVVAPIPGKAAIGIEVPNQRRETVSIRAVLESEAFSSASSALTIALGKDITGQPVVANLSKMPHLLIAGATGTGKSVCINTLLSSLLYRNTPDDVRFLLIDPKRIELNRYE
jgi:S-DNA-T family DNA segregation ATPase FtsK/SpoIIIE